MNLPNKLTLLRVFLVPVFMVFAALGGYGTAENNALMNLLACIVFAAASFTDFLDGNIARKQGLVTDFGKFADPLADKMLTTAALLYMMADGVCHPVVLAIILFREFAVAGVRCLAAADGTVIAANIWGKVKTVTQMIAIIAIIVFRAAYDITLMLLPSSIAQSADFTAAANGWLFWGGEALIWISTVFAIISGVIYLAQNRHFISEK